MAINAGNLAAIGVLRVGVAWDHVDCNDVVLGLRGLKDEGRCAMVVFVGAITDSDCSTIMKGLGNEKITTGKIKALYGPVATGWESSDDLRERDGRRGRWGTRRVMSKAGKNVFVLVKGKHRGT